MFKFKGNTRKVYFPVLFDNDGEWIADGEDYESLEKAENHAAAMVKEFVEETGENCYARIETRFVPIYEYEEGVWNTQ